MNRRAILAALASFAALFRPKSAAAEGGWPHSHVGRVWKRSPESYGRGGYVFVGRFQIEDRILEPGRVYTKAEWERVQADVIPYIDSLHAKIAKEHIPELKRPRA